jgi:hypothetical protein
VNGVLAGDIDRFVVAFHRWRVGEQIASTQRSGGAGE